MTRLVKKIGKELELQVAEAYRWIGAREVAHDVELTGHQIDVYVEVETPDRGLHRIAVEAKDWSLPVGVDTVVGFAQIINLLRRQNLIDQGVIVSASGFSRAARTAAMEYDIQLLQLSDLEAHVAAGTPLQLQPEYVPPVAPDPDVIPDPGLLPPGSRIPFSRNALFTGRVEVLRALARALLHNEAPSAVVTQALQGMGGVGKTQLAVEFAYRYGRFFHGVHWLNAGRPEGLEAEVAACGEAMALPGWPEKLPEQVARTLEAWRRGGRRLVVLDNLEEVEAAREWLARLSGGGARVLVTARRSDWPRDLGLRPLRLEVFSLEEGRAFLRRYLVEERATEEELDGLAERLGHLPLALELAGRYLQRMPRLRVATYLRELEDPLSHPSMAGWREGLGSPTGHDLDLATTFALSWHRVTDEAARRLFLLTGYCAPSQPIPHELLEVAAELGTQAYNEALNSLVNLGLLQMDDSGPGPTIHPLLSEYARCQESDSGLATALANTLARLAREANDRMDQTGSPSHFLLLLPHVRSVAEVAGEENMEEVVSLWMNLGYYLGRVADYTGAKAAFERALAIGQAVYGAEHPNVATTVNNLALVLHNLGDLAGAQAAFERALAINETAYGPNHPNVATSINNLGSVLRDLGDLAGAQAAFERALAINEAVYGPDHPEVAASVNNLGSILRDLGDLAGARAAYEHALAIDETVYGPNHPNVAIRVNNLGSTLQDLGDLAGARGAFERALAINEAVYGLDHPSVATIANNLGMALQDLGDLAGAREAFERALAIDEAVYGPDHPEAAASVNNLGSVLQAIGDLAGARAAFERALAINERVYGPDHPNVATSINNLGSVLRDLGDLSGARAAFERALAMNEAVYGPDHPTIATSVNNLASVLEDLGDLVAARAAYERALGILEGFLSPEHPNIRIVRKNLEILGRQTRA